MKTVLLLDIDGVLCEAQQPISDRMRSAITSASFIHDIVLVTGNTFTKSVDLINWHGFAGIFCNNGDELRDKFGYCVWRDTETPPLPDGLGTCLERSSTGSRKGNNSIEWRSPRFVNYSYIGRYATKEQRQAHIEEYKKPYGDWRDTFMPELRDLTPFGKDIEIVRGGAVSVDIYSKGADKARAAKYLNECDQRFIFIGDKTALGGNDYPIIKYCEQNPQIENKCFTSNGPSNTLELLEQVLRANEDPLSHAPRTNRGI